MGESFRDQGGKIYRDTIYIGLWDRRKQMPKEGRDLYSSHHSSGIGTISPEHIVSEQLVSRGTSKMNLLADVQPVYENAHYPELVYEKVNSHAI
jgi:hypothetical protein